MRLLLDEHISPDVAEGLRGRGHDAVSVIEIGRRTEDDDVLWRKAIEAGRAMVTYNRDDFIALAAESFQNNEPHPGLIVISPKTIPPSDIGGLVRALERLLTSGEDIAGQTLYLTRAAAL